MRKSCRVAHDTKRNIFFKIGDRVHWFEYSADMIIVGGGFGLVIDIRFEDELYGSDDDYFLLHVLKDGSCRVDIFPIQDCDLDEQWVD